MKSRIHVGLDSSLGAIIKINKWGEILPSDTVQLEMACHASQHYIPRQPAQPIRYGPPWDIYDNGSGKLWIMRNSICAEGVVRAETFEDAYACFTDEIMCDGEEPPAYYGDGDLIGDAAAQMIESGDNRSREEIVEALEHECACWDEANGFRGGTPENPYNKDYLKTGIYEKDINGESVEPLTVKFCYDYGLCLQFSTWGNEPKKLEEKLTLTFLR